MKAVCYLGKSRCQTLIFDLINLNLVGVGESNDFERMREKERMRASCCKTEEI